MTPTTERLSRMTKPKVAVCEGGARLHKIQNSYATHFILMSAGLYPFLHQCTQRNQIRNGFKILQDFT
jgi:hypothetical protein